MAEVVVEGVLGDDEAQRRATPRVGFVIETEVSPGCFRAGEGPFSSYERRFEVDVDGQSYVDRTTFSLDIGFWRWLFTRPVRSHLRKRPRDESSPWWAPPDVFSPRAARVLGLLAVLSMGIGYLGTLLTQTITFAVDEFGTSNSAQGATLAAVRFGILLALVITTLADRRGRRRALVGGMVASCLLTALGAIAPNLAVLGGTQTLSRGCASAVGILIAVSAAEEMPAGSRAYAVSLLAMSTGTGAGLALILLPLADTALTAWRLLFAVPLLFIPIILKAGQSLPESLRFVRTHDESAGLAGHGKRFWLLAGSAFLGSIFIAPASQFMNDFLRDEQGFSAARISMFSVFTNLPGSIGIVVAGRLADIRGRRVIGAIGMFGGVGFTLAVYLGDGSIIWLWSVLAALIGAATIPALGVYGPELFPTAVRGKANGVISVVGVVGSSLGLLAAGRLSDQFDRFGPALTILAVGPLLLTILILVAYPETARQELESLNPEDRPDQQPPAGAPVGHV